MTDRQTEWKAQSADPRRTLNGLVACIVNFQALIKMRLRTKSAGTIEQKGVAQLLQIEKVRLKSTRRCGFSHSPHAQHFSSLLHSLKHTLLGSISCMQTYFYLDEVSRHWKFYLQKSVTRKMTDKYIYTVIAH